MGSNYSDGKAGAVPTPRPTGHTEVDSGINGAANHPDTQNSHPPFGGDIYGSETGHVDMGGPINSPGSTETSNTQSEASGDSK